MCTLSSRPRQVQAANVQMMKVKAWSEKQASGKPDSFSFCIRLSCVDAIVWLFLSCRSFSLKNLCLEHTSEPSLKQDPLTSLNMTTSVSLLSSAHGAYRQSERLAFFLHRISAILQMKTNEWKLESARAWVCPDYFAQMNSVAKQATICKRLTH